jgi:hypothetical protein
MPSADITISVMILIINCIKYNWRLAQWDGKSACISQFLTSAIFIPFTGMRFALMQVKTGLCHILSRFEVAPCKETPVRVGFEPKSFLLQMHGEIRLCFNRIKFWNNTHTHTHTHIYIYIYIYIYICKIHLKYPHTKSLNYPHSIRPFWRCKCFVGK